MSAFGNTPLRRTTRTACLLAVVLAALPPTVPAEDGPVLTIDAGGHTDSITGLLSAGPDRLITGSYDKTVRIWDLKSGETEKILRGETGDGSHGEIRALALTPDRKTLLVGGCFDRTEQGRHPIRVYDLRSGSIRELLQAHDHPVTALAMHPRGRYLASGDLDGVVRLWKRTADGFQHVVGLRGHDRQVSNLAFAPTGSDLLVSTGHDGKVCFWKITRDGLTLQKSLEPLSFQRLTGLAFHPDGKSLAVGGGPLSAPSTGTTGEVAFLDRSAKAVATPWRFPSGVSSLVFAPDGTRVAVGCGYPSVDCRAFVLSYPDGKLLTQFRGHDSTVGRMLFLPGGKEIVSSGGQDNRILLWDAETSAKRLTLSSRTRSIWSVGVSRDGKTIYWGDKLHDPKAMFGVEKFNDRGPLTFGLDLSGPDLVRVKDPDAVRGTIRHGDEQLTLKQGKDFQYVQLEGRLPKLASRRDTDVVFGLSFLPQSVRKKSKSSLPPVLIAGTRALATYDSGTGRMLRELIGHTSAVLSVAPSPSADFAVSGGGDQTVKLWHLPSGKPLLNIFRAGNDWVAWTPQGYYAASPQGDRLIGWQVNHGEGRDPEHFVASQFSKTFFRPDVIRLLLTTGNVEQALELADRQRGRAAPKVSIDEALPPTVSIAAPGDASVSLVSDTLVVRAVAASRGAHPVTNLQLLLNGRPYLGRFGRHRVVKPVLGEVTAEWTVTLTSGTHQLSVQAESAVSKAVSKSVEVRYQSDSVESEPPSLYILAIGISDYRDPSLSLNYAADDAAQIERVFREQAAPLFGTIETKRIVDAQATAGGIKAGLEWLRSKMGQRDVGVVFYSGHGQTDADGSFYLLPSDVETSNLPATGVSGGELKQVLAGIPGRLVVMLDACHAGAATSQSRAAPTDSLIRDLVTDDYGIVVMCSSLSREVSLESNQHRQGYFTVALTEGLGGQADYNKDASVSLNELDLYVSDRVSKLTSGRQTPVTAKPASVPSFALTKT